MSEMSNNHRPVSHDSGNAGAQNFARGLGGGGGGQRGGHQMGRMVEDMAKRLPATAVNAAALGAATAGFATLDAARSVANLKLPAMDHMTKLSLRSVVPGPSFAGSVAKSGIKLGSLVKALLPGV